MVYFFTLYLSLFGLPSSLLHPLPHSLRLAFSVPPGEPWPGISDAFSLSCLIPELVQEDKVRVVETKIKQRTHTIWWQQLRALTHLCLSPPCPLLLSSYYTFLLLLVTNNCRGGIHYSFFCILREYVGVWGEEVRQEQEKIRQGVGVKNRCECARTYLSRIEVGVWGRKVDKNVKKAWARTHLSPSRNNRAS